MGATSRRIYNYYRRRKFRRKSRSITSVAKRYARISKRSEKRRR